MIAILWAVGALLLFAIGVVVAEAAIIDFKRRVRRNG
jgi:hypothetical protein